MNDRQAAAHSKRSKRPLSRWVCGLVALTLAVVLAAVVFPIFARHSERRPHVSCLRNLKQVCLASLMYALDHDEVFVRMPGWDDALYPYAKNREVYRCPDDETNGALSYGMNVDVAGSTLVDWPTAKDIVSFYDGTSVVVIERHKDGANYAFMDGHAKWLGDPPEDSGLFVSGGE